MERIYVPYLICKLKYRNKAFGIGSQKDWISSNAVKVVLKHILEALEVGWLSDKFLDGLLTKAGLGRERGRKDTGVGKFPRLSKARTLTIPLNSNWLIRHPTDAAKSLACRVETVEESCIYGKVLLKSGHVGQRWSLETGAK